jgi:hypothetical protein
MLTRRLLECRPEGSIDKAVLQRLDDFYKGGPQFFSRLTAYLPQRPAESAIVYQYRQKRAVYLNYSAATIDWLAANLFSKDAEISIVAEGEDDKPEMPEDWTEFLDDVDGRGTSWSSFWRKMFIRALIDKKSYLGWAFPKADVPAANRAQQKDAGALRAVLKRFKRITLNDCGHDEQGNLKWAIFEFDVSDRASPESKREDCVKEWMVVTSESVTIYRRNANVDATKEPDEKELATIVSQTTGLSGIPLVELKLPHGLAIGLKIDSVVCSLFNKWSDYAWAVQMTCFPQWEEFGQAHADKLGEAYIRRYDSKDKGLVVVETSGAALGKQAEDIEKLKDELYRTIQQMALAVKTDAATAGRSGESKAWDYESTNIVLRAYGEIVRECMRRTLNAIAKARGESFEFDVTGLDEFSGIADLAEYLNTVDAAAKTIAKSETLRRVIDARIALTLAGTESEKTKREIIKEIESAPAEETRENDAEEMRPDKPMENPPAKSSAARESGRERAVENPKE